MKAVRLVQPGRPLELHVIPLPLTGDDDVLVRVKAAGICHSDAHYRAGISRVDPLPLTLGHEVAGVVDAIGRNVKQIGVGERVCLHYMVTCGRCVWCAKDNEQFCETGAMIGKSRDGGYAEFIAIPARSVFQLPDEIPFEHGAILMCSSATSLHALNKARMKPGESVAIFGAGGLGMSAIQLAKALGAREVFAVDIQPNKLEFARSLGAVPIDARAGDPVKLIRDHTEGRGVDVALELIGLPLTMQQSMRVLAKQGRAALAGITDKNFEVSPYHDLVNREAEIIGVSDHLAAEIPLLLEFARTGKLNLSNVVTRTIPLEAKAINDMLDQLEQFGEEARVVITP
jgi:2-desacetyl-2-hydroxyethyl bacteriochlorophyllide A dehydrogenase